MQGAGPPGPPPPPAHAPGCRVEEVYECGKELGKGYAAIVYEARHRETGHVYAVKVVTKANLRPPEIARLQVEARLMREIDHPGIVKCHDTFEDAARFSLVMDLLRGGELFDRVTSRTFMTEDDAKRIMVTLLTSLAYLHGRGVVHRDIKLENLLFTTAGHDAAMRLCDFGFAGELRKPEDRTLKELIGTPRCVAPELLNRKPYGTSIDMWAAGVLLYSVLVGYSPFDHPEQKEMYRNIRLGHYKFHEQYWCKVSDGAKGLVTRLLMVNPDTRLTAAEALRDPWLANSIPADSPVRMMPMKAELSVDSARSSDPFVAATDVPAAAPRSPPGSSASGKAEGLGFPASGKKAAAQLTAAAPTSPRTPRTPGRGAAGSGGAPWSLTRSAARAYALSRSAAAALVEGARGWSKRKPGKVEPVAAAAAAAATMAAASPTRSDAPPTPTPDADGTSMVAFGSLRMKPGAVAPG